MNENTLRFENLLTGLGHKKAVDLTRFRCGNYKLPIVVGRYTGIPRAERPCKICDT